MVKCFMVDFKYYENSISEINNTKKYTYNKEEKLDNHLQLVLKKYIDHPDIINKLTEEGIELRFK